MDKHQEGCCGGGHTANGDTTVKDPVCGMDVNPATAKHRHEHGDATFYFCSGGCKEKFAAEPAKYLEKRETPPRAK